MAFIYPTEPCRHPTGKSASSNNCWVVNREKKTTSRLTFVGTTVNWSDQKGIPINESVNWIYCPLSCCCHCFGVALTLYMTTGVTPYIMCNIPCGLYNLEYDFLIHYNDVIMGVIASKITSLTIVYSTVYSGTDQIKHQCFASLAFVWGIHRWPVNSPHKWPVTREMFPFDDVIMNWWIHLWVLAQLQSLLNTQYLIYPQVMTGQRYYWATSINNKPDRVSHELLGSISLMCLACENYCCPYLKTKKQNKKKKQQRRDTIRSW